MISLGIGDPDLPTPPAVVDALAAAARDPATHQYPTNRGTSEFREAGAASTATASGSSSTRTARSIPALGGKECVGHICARAASTRATSALAPDPGYPPYTGGPVFAGATVALPAARARRTASCPTSTRSRRGGAPSANLLFLNYPNNPTGAVVPSGFFERVVAFAREHDDPRRPRQRLLGDDCFDGYVAPSFLETPGAKEVGVEVFSLSKGCNMTGWRCGRDRRQRRRSSSATGS